MVVAVAEESRGADHARPWIEEAKSGYWQLIDTEHRLSDLYNLVNVPQAVWIDEQGLIVRPPETAGSTDHFRRMDLKTRTMSPEDQAERLAARQAYLDAVRAWVTTGKHALPADQAREAAKIAAPCGETAGRVLAALRAGVAAPASTHHRWRIGGAVFPCLLPVGWRTAFGAVRLQQWWHLRRHGRARVRSDPLAQRPGVFATRRRGGIRLGRARKRTGAVHVIGRQHGSGVARPTLSARRCRLR